MMTITALTQHTHYILRNAGKRVPIAPPRPTPPPPWLWRVYIGMCSCPPLHPYHTSLHSTPFRSSAMIDGFCGFVGP